MRIKVTLEFELEVKPRFCKLLHQNTYNRKATEIWLTPTDTDIQEYITHSLDAAKVSFKHENNFAPCRLLDFGIKETTICLQKRQ